MGSILFRWITGKLIIVLMLVTGAVAFAAEGPFGGKTDVNYAQELWKAMVSAKLVGKDAIRVRPFEGNQPHGAIQQVLDTKITVQGKERRVVVKRNHGGKGVTVESVYDDQNKDLKAVTVMVKREKGYDADNQDWFWAKYTSDGKLDKNPKGLLLAGRVAKGADKGCIACHKATGGADLETLTSK